MAAQRVEYGCLQTGIQRRAGIDLLVLFDGRPLAADGNPPVNPFGLRQQAAIFSHLVRRQHVRNVIHHCGVLSKGGARWPHVQTQKWTFAVNIKVRGSPG
jgi:hypothetical protein